MFQRFTTFTSVILSLFVGGSTLSKFNFENFSTAQILREISVGRIILKKLFLTVLLYALNFAQIFLHQKSEPLKFPKLLFQFSLLWFNE